MDWKELVPLQHKLNTIVYEKFKLHQVPLHQKRKAWIIVELSELANELRFFKYASRRQEPEDPDKVLEEYIDVVHLTLSTLLYSYGNNVKDAQAKLDKIKPYGYDFETEDLFGVLWYEISSNLYTRIDIIVSYVMGLGKHLGYSNDKILTAYKRKHAINLHRQKMEY